jgi:excisionase family DNA binding protein
VGEDRRDDPRRRLSVGEAADELGVSVDAIRSRVKRGTIPHVRRGGRVWVLLGTVQDNRPTQDQSEIEALREQVEWLRGEIQRKDAILLNMTEAMKALSPPQETPSEARGSTETGEEQQGRGQPQSATVESQEPIQRPWWRRVFGG